MEGRVDLGYPAMHRPGVELAIFRSQVRCPKPLHHRTAANLYNDLQASGLSIKAKFVRLVCIGEAHKC